MRGLRLLMSWSVLHIMLLLVVLLALVMFSGSQNQVRIDLQHSVFDQFNRMYPRTPTDAVMIVDIDERSLDAYGQWPWPRNIMAGLVGRLTALGAKVIAFDGVFAEEDRSSPIFVYKNLPVEMKADLGRLSHIDYDRQFANAIKQSGIFVTAFTYGREDRPDSQPIDQKRILARSNVTQAFLQDASRFDAAAVNLPIFSGVAAGNGSFMARPDRDGALRRTGMVFTNGKTLYPSLGAEAVRVALMGRKGTLRIAETPQTERGEIDTAYRLVIADKVVPVESDGVLQVYYRYFCNEQDMQRNVELCTRKDYISAAQVMDDTRWSENRDALKEKIILIGASAEGLKDLRSTALQPFRPGVEVHANVVEQILQGEYLLRPEITQAAEALFILAMGVFFIAIAPFIGVLLSLVLCVVMVCGAVFMAVRMYVDYGLLVDPVYPSLSVVLIFILSTILSYARVEARRKQTRNAFGMYVARDVLRDLERNPEKLRLGGESRELTVMFSDIRQFTKISEGMPPQELIQLMNDFLTVMTEIVMRYGGTVDKYIGDAMMAFWNAPRDVEGHERQACLAALAMQGALEQVNKKIAARAEEQGKEPLVLRAGIGLNTGMCAVGNMGSRQRFAYSALGDAVNLASRLEGQTKFYAVDIVIGESVYNKVHDFAALELDYLRVVGREKPAKVYGLFGGEATAKTAEFIAWKGAHDAFLSLYRARRFDEAQSMISKCIECAQEQGTGLYDMYERRIQSLRQQDLPADWDGSFDARRK